jgi:hypothetical protein
VEFGIPVTLETQPDLSDIRAFYQHGCGNFWVAEVNGNIAMEAASSGLDDRIRSMRLVSIDANRHSHTPPCHRQWPGAQAAEARQ